MHPTVYLGALSKREITNLLMYTPYVPWYYHSPFLQKSGRNHISIIFAFSYSLSHIFIFIWKNNMKRSIVLHPKEKLDKWCLLGTKAMDRWGWFAFASLHEKATMKRRTPPSHKVVLWYEKKYRNRRKECCRQNSLFHLLPDCQISADSTHSINSWHIYSYLIWSLRSYLKSPSVVYEGSARIFFQY